ncbi:MAG: acetate/propionate family kinase [Candidatus Omnitrophica bacterium]|nr:acetate/propionate family kinase [Candidatus Omnitrophota bacterium]
MSYRIFKYQGARNVELILKGKAYRVGGQGMKSSYIENQFNGKTTKEILPISDYVKATALAVDYINKNNIRVDAIGHRFVHGGEYFKRSVLLDRTSLKRMERCLPLAPLHNPISMNIIKETIRMFPRVPQYAVIDSAFHSSIPAKAYTYPVPRRIIEQYQYRRYGFHGISCSYVCRHLSEFLKKSPGKINMIVCHLGTGGASVTAIKKGCSVDTSMGFSPNSGLIMSTRSGDIDPMVVVSLMQISDFHSQEISDLLNKRSGLLGISGFSSDITDIIAFLGHKRFGKRAQLAFDMYVNRLKSYIGRYLMVLGGQVDALVFTDDIGVNNPLIRESVCRSLCWAGIVIDKKKNEKVSREQTVSIQSSSSKIAVVTMPTEEEMMICLEGARLLKGCR